MLSSTERSENGLVFFCFQRHSAVPRMADNNLLVEPENFDEVDQNLFAVQLRNLCTVHEREARLTPHERRLRKIVHKLYPVGVEANKESLIRMKQRVRENDRIQAAWERQCDTYKQNETFEDVCNRPLTLSDVYVLDIVARITSTKDKPHTKLHFPQITWSVLPYKLRSRRTCACGFSISFNPVHCVPDFLHWLVDMQRKGLCGVPRRGVDAVCSGGARRDVFGVRGCDLRLKGNISITFPVVLTVSVCGSWVRLSCP